MEQKSAGRFDPGTPCGFRGSSSGIALQAQAEGLGFSLLFDDSSGLSVEALQPHWQVSIGQQQQRTISVPLVFVLGKANVADDGQNRLAIRSDRINILKVVYSAIDWLDKVFGDLSQLLCDRSNAIGF